MENEFLIHITDTFCTSKKKRPISSVKEFTEIIKDVIQ